MRLLSLPGVSSYVRSRILGFLSFTWSVEASDGSDRVFGRPCDRLLFFFPAQFALKLLFSSFRSFGLYQGRPSSTNGKLLV